MCSGVVRDIAAWRMMLTVRTGLPQGSRCLGAGVWGEKSSGDVRPMRTIVSKLRRKLGDDADNPIYIFTEPRVGYRMPKGNNSEQ